MEYWDRSTQSGNRATRIWPFDDHQKARTAASERYTLVPTSTIIANHLMMRRRTSYYLLPRIAFTKPGYLAQRPGSEKKKEAATPRPVSVTFQQLVFVIQASE